MQHLFDFFDRYVRGRRAALLYDDGFRKWSYTCDELRATAETFALRIKDAGLQPGDRLVIWTDNCPEWVAAFWGAIDCPAAGGTTVVVRLPMGTA